MSKNRIFIIGGSGLLGSCFKKIFPENSFSIGRSEENDFVINNDVINSFEDLITSNDLIVHSAWDINLINWERDNKLEDHFKSFSRNIFSFSKKRKIKCIFISTDQVYGEEGPHNEESATSPLNKYGKVKLECEKLALQSKASVARLNFLNRDPKSRERGWVEKLLIKAKNDEPITLFDNIYFSPCSGIKAATIIYKLGIMNLNDTFNIGCKEKFSKSDIAQKILNYLDIKCTNIDIKSVDSFPDKISRSKDLSMDISKVETTLNLELETQEELIKNICK